MEMSTDVTEMKLLQSQLKLSQEKYRLLFEEVPCFISIQDRDLRIVEANRLHREAFGTSYGKKCYEAYKHRKSACEPCIVQQTFKDGEVHAHEEVVTSKDNKRINVMVVTAPIRYLNHEIDQVVEMSVDITQIRQLQDKLTSVGMLIGTISHGIKGLLNALDGGIYLVNTGLKKDDRSRIDQGWEIASRNIRRIRSMVMDILYYAKDDLGKADFKEMTMSGPGVYLEKPVSKVKYVAAVRKLLGLEPLEASGTDQGSLEKSLADALKEANPEDLQRALDALKKK